MDSSVSIVAGIQDGQLSQYSNWHTGWTAQSVSTVTGIQDGQLSQYSDWHTGWTAQSVQ